ncbi:MAG TPA: TRAP transporter substrate-binding protein [Xanthobacteraceae bacterium]|jgi:TRAP-type transport system periplasmic protein|nr:TRAP transporter substrate-binding protein [Xanthobacteraceae bacterium]
MRVARRSFLASIIGCAAAAPALLPRRVQADAPQLTLKMHHSFSSVSGVHDRFLVPWARKVEADSGGHIRIDIYPLMQLGGAPAQLFDQARDGLADIVWTVPSHTPGRFPKIEAFELPFVPASRALVSSKAIEDYAAANLADEFREVRPLCFSCRDRAVVHATRTLQGFEELRGLKLHVPNRLADEAVRALGGQAVAMPISQVLLALSGRVINGCLDPWDAAPGLKLYDVLKAHTDFADAALSTTAFVLAMNRGAYDRLPRPLKSVIDANSGQPAAGMAGAMWDVEAAGAVALARERGDAVTVLPPKEVLRWRRATEPVIAAWVKQMKERRIDGDKLLADIRELLEKYAGEPEPQPQPPPRPSPQPAPEQKVVAQPQPRPEAKVEPPRAAAPAPAPAATPAAKPPPAAASRPKELDIPL